jgi:RsiW-degrading membrane proteinase PrsW (M82 family)
MGGGYFPNSGQHNPGQHNPGQPYPGQPYPGQQPAVPIHEYSFASLVPVRHWVRDPALRSWPVLLLVVLVCVPPIALVLLNNATESTIHAIAWIFAAYFAVAWLLLLGVIVRPQHVTRAMLGTIAVIGIVTQAPIAIFLETKLHAGTGSLLDIFTIGLPEELAKAVPIVAVALIWRAKWQEQAPRDYLFLGAVSGLVFGAAEAVHYFIDVLGSLSGNANGILLQGLTIQYIWRFLTDPIDHATWAGITGYFIGLAVTGHTRKYAIGLIGIGIAAVLHGLNDWNPINSHPTWVLITLISVLLFLGYARAGALLPPAFAAAAASTASIPVPGQPAHGAPAGPAFPAFPAAPPPAHPRAQPPTPAQPGTPVPQEAWWQAPPQAPRPVPAAAASHPGAASHPHPGSQPTVVTPVTVSQKIPPKPWWEQ